MISDVVHSLRLSMEAACNSQVVAKRHGNVCPKCQVPVAKLSWERGSQWICDNGCWNGIRFEENRD